LSPALFTEAFRNIKSLRIHHSVITNRPFLGKDRPVSEQCFELHSEDLRYELDSTEIAPLDILFELDDTSIDVELEPIEPTLNIASDTLDDLHTRLPRDGAARPLPDFVESAFQASKDIHPIFESPDAVGAGLSPSASVKARRSAANRLNEHPSTINTLSRRHLSRKISIHSNPENLPCSQPSPARNQAHFADHRLPFNTTNSPDTAHDPETYAKKYSIGEGKSWQEAGMSVTKAISTKEIIAEVNQRRHRTESRERHPGRFKPSMLPNLKTLILTDVPSTTRRRDLIDSLIIFITECAEVEELARLEDLEWQESGSHSRKREKSCCGIFKLQRLVLEMSSAPDPILPPRSPKDKRQSFTKSSTEDPDSEMFMEASESDFSFFGEDDGGLLVSEGRIDTPIILDDGLVFMGDSTDRTRPVDVVSELATFRRARKLAHEAAIRVGKSTLDRALSGHWLGEVKIVKNVHAS
jgi:hypothetical protein